MLWSSPGSAIRRMTRAALALAAAGFLAGCFQPLYGEKSFTSAAGTGLNDKLNQVEVVPISAPNGTPEARLGVEIRNALLFDINKESAASGGAYQLRINLRTSRQQVIVDIYTIRPEVENYGIDATYSLTEVATNKVVLTGQTFARVSFDTPGQQQRFARARALRDAETRASKLIAEQIRSRLASYFVAGT
jgi:LPS-assembly lipoprotein